MKKLKIGVIGVSEHFLTRIMLPLSKSESVELIGVASRNIEKARQVADEWKVPKAFGSYEALLEDSEIEAVYIPLPNHLHLEWVKKSIDAGKHVLCEKPLTLNAEETKELMAYAKGKGVKIMEAFMYRFHPKWQMVKDLMKVSGIGEVNAIHTIFTYNNNDPKNIRNNKDFGGGALMDIGCYAISSARWIMGREPEAVVAMNHFSEDFGTDVLSSAILDFGKARALFTVSTSIYPAQEVKVYGTGGFLEVVIPFNDLYDISGMVKVTTGLGSREIEFEPTNQYGSLLDAFAKAIKDDEDVPLSLEDSLMNMHIIDQLFESGRTKQWITL
jgi:predicted dehydrogenase